jgi:hypothetical protein
MTRTTHGLAGVFVNAIEINGGDDGNAPIFVYPQLFDGASTAAGGSGSDSATVYPVLLIVGAVGVSDWFPVAADPAPFIVAADPAPFIVPKGKVPVS